MKRFRTWLATMHYRGSREVLSVAHRGRSQWRRANARGASGSVGQALPLWQIAVRAQHAGTDRECRNEERRRMEPRRERKRVFLLP
jgi:hypothetical protein